MTEFRPQVWENAILSGRLERKLSGAGEVNSELLHAMIARVGNVKAILRVNPQTGRPRKLSRTGSTLSQPVERLAATVKHLYPVQKRLPNIDIPFPVDCQSVILVHLGELDLTAKVSLHIEDLEPLVSSIEDHQRAPVGRDLCRFSKLSWLRSTAAFSEVSDNMPFSVEGDHHIAARVANICAPGRRVYRDANRSFEIGFPLMFPQVAAEFPLRVVNED